jgi:hypothetical protein
VNESARQTLSGMGWVAERDGGRTTASVPTGKWDTGEFTFDISNEDFERLRTDPGSFNLLFKKYNEIKGDSWTAQREEICIVYLRPDRFPDNRRFAIPHEAFERLQRDPGLFEELYSTYHTNYV